MSVLVIDLHASAKPVKHPFISVDPGGVASAVPSGYDRSGACDFTVRPAQFSACWLDAQSVTVTKFPALLWQ
jgi:hypothetical protein